MKTGVPQDNLGSQVQLGTRALRHRDESELATLTAPFSHAGNGHDQEANNRQDSSESEPNHRRLRHLPHLLRPTQEQA